MQTFMEIKKLPDWAPKCRIALLKRACRKKPAYGYCPVLESLWGHANQSHLLNAEQLLHYFHLECAAAVAALKQDAVAFKATVDCAVLEAFAICSNMKEVRKAMLEASSKYYHQLKEGNTAVVEPSERWIVFPESEQEISGSSPKSSCSMKQRGSL